VLLAVPAILFWQPIFLGCSCLPTDAPYFADAAFAPYRPPSL
jgi:hypothetical protein